MEERRGKVWDTFTSAQKDYANGKILRHWLIAAAKVSSWARRCEKAEAQIKESKTRGEGILETLDSTRDSNMTKPAKAVLKGTRTRKTRADFLFLVNEGVYSNEDGSGNEKDYEDDGEQKISPNAQMVACLQASFAKLAEPDKLKKAQADSEFPLTVTEIIADMLVPKRGYTWKDISARMGGPPRQLFDDRVDFPDMHSPLAHRKRLNRSASESARSPIGGKTMSDFIKYAKSQPDYLHHKHSLEKFQGLSSELGNDGKSNLPVLSPTCRLERDDHNTPANQADDEDYKLVAAGKKYFNTNKFDSLAQSHLSKNVLLQENEKLHRLARLAIKRLEKSRTLNDLRRVESWTNRAKNSKILAELEATTFALEAHQALLGAYRMQHEYVLERIEKVNDLNAIVEYNMVKAMNSAAQLEHLIEATGLAVIRQDDDQNSSSSKTSSGNLSGKKDSISPVFSSELVESMQQIMDTLEKVYGMVHNGESPDATLAQLGPLQTLDPICDPEDARRLNDFIKNLTLSDRARVLLDIDEARRQFQDPASAAVQGALSVAHPGTTARYLETTAAWDAAVREKRREREERAAAKQERERELEFYEGPDYHRKNVAGIQDISNKNQIINEQANYIRQLEQQNRELNSMIHSWKTSGRPKVIGNVDALFPSAGARTGKANAAKYPGHDPKTWDESLRHQREDAIISGHRLYYPDETRKSLTERVQGVKFETAASMTLNPKRGSRNAGDILELEHRADFRSQTQALPPSGNARTAQRMSLKNAIQEEDEEDEGADKADFRSATASAASTARVNGAVSSQGSGVIAGSAGKQSGNVSEVSVAISGASREKREQRKSGTQDERTQFAARQSRQEPGSRQKETNDEHPDFQSRAVNLDVDVRMAPQEPGGIPPLDIFFESSNMPYHRTHMRASEAPGLLGDRGFKFFTDNSQKYQEKCENIGRNYPIDNDLISFDQHDYDRALKDASGNARIFLPARRPRKHSPERHDMPCKSPDDYHQDYNADDKFLLRNDVKEDAVANRSQKSPICPAMNLYQPLQHIVEDHPLYAREVAPNGGPADLAFIPQYPFRGGRFRDIDVDDGVKHVHAAYATMLQKYGTIHEESDTRFEQSLSPSERSKQAAGTSSSEPEPVGNVVEARTSVGSMSKEGKDLLKSETHTMFHIATDSDSHSGQQPVQTVTTSQKLATAALSKKLKAPDTSSDEEAKTKKRRSRAVDFSGGSSRSDAKSKDATPRTSSDEDKKKRKKSLAASEVKKSEKDQKDEKKEKGPKAQKSMKSTKSSKTGDLDEKEKKEEKKSMKSSKTREADEDSDPKKLKSMKSSKTKNVDEKKEKKRKESDEKKEKKSKREKEKGSTTPREAGKSKSAKKQKKEDGDTTPRDGKSRKS